MTKANDVPEGPLFSFRSEVHEFGHDEDGDPITVNVVSSHELDARPIRSSGLRWPKGLKPDHEAITGAILEHGVDHRIAGGGPVVRAVERRLARQVHARRFVNAGDGDPLTTERQTWSRGFKEPRARGLISGETLGSQELVWLVST